MADIKINKETVVGKVVKDDKNKFVISAIESSIGNYISIQTQYLKDEEWHKGKGQWLPIEFAGEILDLAQSALEEFEEVE